MSNLEKAVKMIRENGNVPYYFQPFKQPKDHFWLIIGILTPLAIGSVIFFFWYLNLIINGFKPL